MVNSPLVTVNILSFNRKDELRNTLTKVIEQDYKNIEIIVVDNASSDGSPLMVEEEFPEVNLIKLRKNIGIAGWNKGFKAARGEFILVLDDDSYPVEREFISKNLEQFTESNIGLLSFKIYNNYLNKFEFDKFSIKVYPYFIGCGAMIKRELLTTVGLFNNVLFLYNHEDDYILRLYDNGYKIRFVDSTINHNYSYLNRTSDRRKFYSTRNTLLILFLHYNLNKVFFRMIRIIIGRLSSGIKQGSLIIIIKGIISFFLIIPVSITKRKPVKLEIQKMFNYGSSFGGFHFRDNNWFN